MSRLVGMDPLKIFLVEDNLLYARASQHHLVKNQENEVLIFANGDACLKALHQEPDIIFLDYSLPDFSGTRVLKEIIAHDPDIPVVIVSGQDDVSTAVNLLKEGAYDYINKDENARERMWNAVNHIRKNRQMKRELQRLRKEVSEQFDFSSIRGNSPVLDSVFTLLRKAADSNINVVLTGETGTGKELAARAIHYNSKRRTAPFVVTNLAAIPQELVESELFGHEKGAFTGAHISRVGKFEEAAKGTLFLDEVGELSLATQAKLLRVLQEREFSRLGSNKQLQVQARIIVATNADLVGAVREGRFREDLYYRLIGLPIEMPPLRKRGSDVLYLANHFIAQFAQDNEIPQPQLSPTARQKLLDYHWPGNVRELKAVVELGAVLARNHLVEEEDIRLHALGANRVVGVFKRGLTLRDYTRRIIEDHLLEHQNNVVQVAQQLDIGKSTIYRMIKNRELNIK